MSLNLSSSQFAVRAGALTLAWALSGSASQALAAPQFWDQHTASSTLSPNMFPQDCGATTDHRRAAVRYADPSSNPAVVGVWDLTGPWSAGSASPLAVFGGGALKSGFPTALSGGYRYRPSDRIELTNEWGVSIGSGASAAGGGVIDETYIEVFMIGTTPPSFVQQFTVPAASGQDVAGYANDLAITRDAQFAVVNSRNWIQVLQLSVPPGAVSKLDFNIGSLDYSTTPPTPWTRPCDPDGAVDSVAVTNERAVVTTKRFSATANTFTTWVYIIDLVASGGPTIVLQHEILPPADWEPESESDVEHPHDVAITPSRDGGGTRAVVTTNHSVALYDLVTNTFVARHFDEKDRRQYQQQVDSVELTGKVAVVIADVVSASGPTVWGVKLFDVSAASSLPLVASDVDASPPQGGSRAHDLAIDWDFDKGLVRTTETNVYLSSLVTPTAPFQELVGSTVSDAYAYEGYRLQYAGVFSSDSVVIGSEQGGVLMAASIGGIDSQGTFSGQVDLIDLLATTPAVTPVAIVSPSGTLGGCVPLDLAISFNQNEVVVRSAERPTQLPSTPGPDLVRIALASGAFVQTYGGDGVLMGLDSLATPSLTGFVNTARKLLSISEDPLTGLDYVHVAR